MRESPVPNSATSCANVSRFWVAASTTLAFFMHLRAGPGIASSPGMDTDRNLLFGVLALQLDLIDASQFAEACAAWASRKKQPLSDLLRERGWITDDDRRDVDRLLERKLRKHGGNVHESLLTLADADVRAAVQDITDPEIRETLSILPLPRPYALVATVAPPAETRSRYSLSRLHAEGGLGRIYIARDTDLNREVALKEIKPQQARFPEACRRFLKEAQVTGQLEHPNIVPVYELARRPGDNAPFYTMRLVRGETLRDAIQTYHRHRRHGSADALELPRLLRAFVSICHAVAYAHSRRVIHRDLKPENVVLGSFGEVVVLDWGLAKLLGQPEEAPGEAAVAVTEPAETEATAMGRLLGTPAFMAPEQAEGRQDRMGPWTDVYGLGAILFNLLTGVAPHSGSSWSETVRHITGCPTPRARLAEPSVSPALDAICARAMAGKPADRYASATELARDIDRYLADEPVSVHRDALPQRVMRWARRNRAWAGAAALSVFGVLFTLALVSALLARLADQERRARQATDHLREQGVRLAATFAARTVAGEIAMRWRILEAEAADADLQRLLLRIAESDPPGQPADSAELESWIRDRHRRHRGITKATSWLLTDRHGRQLARSPAADTIGRDFRYRDYFHGLGRDLPPSEAAGIAPLHDVHRSIVYESAATHGRMVAFSVPVWASGSGPGPRSVLAVLSMTVELGRFNSLQTDLGRDQIAVLVDSKSDWLQGQEAKGLVLHHPAWAEHPPDRAVFRLDPAHITRLEELRAWRMRRDYELKSADGNPPSTYRAEPSPLNFERAYVDPLGGPYSGPWLAAFEPVLVKGRADIIKDTGWVVIIQERPEPRP